MSRVGPWYGIGGRQRIRVRDTYVRDVVAPLVERGSGGLIKLDLVLRGLAELAPFTAGAVPHSVSWAQLHDMCRGQGSYRGETTLKRKWVNDKLLQLEKLQLVRRGSSHRNRPELTVLSDRQDGTAFDDPGSAGDHYVTVLGELIEFDHLGSWGVAEIAASLSAMNAERHTRADAALAEALGLANLSFGGGRWYRPLTWFKDEAATRRGCLGFC